MESMSFVRTCRGCGATSDQAQFRRKKGCICYECENKRNEARRAARRPIRLPGATSYRKGIGPRAGENTAHLAWIRSMPCACGPGCGYKVHAHHHRMGTGGGVGKKPGPEWTVPLCAAHHSEGHTRGWRTFEAKYGLDLRALAQELALLSPHLSAYSGVSSTAAVRGEVPDRRDA